MRLISLNTWGGKKFEELMEFIRRERERTDIFCFQEIFDAAFEIKNTNGYRANLLHELSLVLEGFQVLYQPYLQNHNFKEQTDFPLSFGNAMFVRSTIPIQDHGSAKIFHADTEQITEHVFVRITKTLQYARLTMGAAPLTVINFHGIWFDGPKTDQADTREQSKRVVEFLATVQPPIIVAGDFNLWPETESLAMIERTGLRNLIREYGISSTRPRNFAFDRPFADYVLVSPEIRAQRFAALLDEISDHLPLELEFKE